MIFCITNGKKWLSLMIALVLLLLGFYGYAASNAEENTGSGIPVPILMYHSILKDKAQAGKYVVSPYMLEQDMKFLKEHGYETVLVSDLISYVYDGTSLPKKPVILTFDDGHYNNLLYVLPLLEQYDMKAVISVVGSYTEEFSQKDSHNPNYSYLTWEDITELSGTGRIEIANHTYGMHDSISRNGCSIQKGETVSEYQSKLSEDLQKLQNEIQKKSKIQKPKTFTYPYGYICTESQKAIENSDFLASLSCYEKISRITRDKNSLYCLGRFNRPSGISTENFMKKIKIP